MRSNPSQTGWRKVMPQLEDVTLKGNLERVERLTLDHTSARVAAAPTDRWTFGLTTEPEAPMTESFVTLYPSVMGSFRDSAMFPLSSRRMLRTR